MCVVATYGSPYDNKTTVELFDALSISCPSSTNHLFAILKLPLTMFLISSSCCLEIGLVNASRYTKALARSMANTKQVKGATPLNTGLPSLTGFTSGDSQQLFSTAHPTLAGTFQNTLTTQADLNETSLEQALIDIAAMTDERGLKIAAKGVKMIVPPANQFTAERLMKSQGRVGTADNDINAVKSLGMIAQGYRVNNFLTDTDSWYITTDVPNGMKHFNRAPLTTKMEGDFDTGNVRYKARERYSFGASDNRGIFGAEGAQ